MLQCLSQAYQQWAARDNGYHVPFVPSIEEGTNYVHAGHGFEARAQTRVVWHTCTGNTVVTLNLAGPVPRDGFKPNIVISRPNQPFMPGSRLDMINRILILCQALDDPDRISVRGLASYTLGGATIGASKVEAHKSTFTEVAQNHLYCVGLACGLNAQFQQMLAKRLKMPDFIGVDFDLLEVDDVVAGGDGESCHVCYDGGIYQIKAEPGMVLFSILRSILSGNNPEAELEDMASDEDVDLGSAPLTLYSDAINYALASWIERHLIEGTVLEFTI